MHFQLLINMKQCCLLQIRLKSIYLINIKPTICEEGVSGTETVAHLICMVFCVMRIGQVEQACEHSLSIPNFKLCAYH